MSISCLSSSFTVQHTINNSPTYLYEHFEFIFATFATLVDTYFGKVITTDSPKCHNPLKSVYLCWQYLPIMLALCSMLLLSHYVQNYAAYIIG